MKRLMSFVKKAALVVVSSMFAVVAAELALRTYRPVYDAGIPESFVSDEELSFRLRPGIHLFRATDHQEESVTGPLGTTNFQEGFGGYGRLVFAVGDSYTPRIHILSATRFLGMEGAEILAKTLNRQEEVSAMMYRQLSPRGEVYARRAQKARLE